MTTKTNKKNDLARRRTPKVNRTDSRTASPARKSRAGLPVFEIWGTIAPPDEYSEGRPSICLWGNQATAREGMDERLRKKNHAMASERDKAKSDLDAAHARHAAIQEELETERMRLAGCSVAALGNTARTIAQRIPPGHPYWSASYGDVCAAVDREIAHRARADASASALTALQEENERLMEENLALAASPDTPRTEVAARKQAIQRMHAAESALTALQQRLDAVYGALREIAKGYVGVRQGMTPATYAQSFLDLHGKIYGADTLASLLPPASQDE